MANPNIRIVVVDDSSVFRSLVTSVLNSCPGIEVVGSAANGKLGLETLREVQADVAIIDLEMPEMDGIALLEAMTSARLNTKAILFASATKHSATSTLRALNRGAVDFVVKPDGASSQTNSVGTKIKELLLPKILEIGANHPRVSATSPTHEPKIVRPYFPAVRWDSFLPRALVVGSSTGGPAALEKILAGIGELRLPVFIVQHMPPLFTTALAERLSSISGLTVCEAVHQEVVKPGKVYLAPGDFHLTLKRTEHQVCVNLDKEPPRHFVRPAVDNLFETAVRTYGAGILGFVLTGMGADGRDGAVAIKQAGGAVVIQEEKSCIVYGMPGAVEQSGAWDEIASLERVRTLILRYGQAGLNKVAA